MRSHGSPGASRSPVSSACRSLGAVPGWVSWGFLAHTHGLSLEGPPRRGRSSCHLCVGTACGPHRLSLCKLRSPPLSSGSLCALCLGPDRAARRPARPPRGSPPGSPSLNAAASCVFFPVFHLFTAGMQTPRPRPTLARAEAPSMLCSMDTHLFSHIRGMFFHDLTFLLSTYL